MRVPSKLDDKSSLPLGEKRRTAMVLLWAFVSNIVSREA